MMSPMPCSNRKKPYFKTKICPWYFRGRCDRGSNCLFAHSHSELRDAPDLSKTSICANIKKYGACNDEGCMFAHNLNELRYTVDLYKTSFCVRFLKGRCSAGDWCRHAHGDYELRSYAKRGGVNGSYASVNDMGEMVSSVGEEEGLEGEGGELYKMGRVSEKCLQRWVSEEGELESGSTRNSVKPFTQNIAPYYKDDKKHRKTYSKSSDLFRSNTLGTIDDVSVYGLVFPKEGMGSLELVTDREAYGMAMHQEEDVPICTRGCSEPVPLEIGREPYVDYAALVAEEKKLAALSNPFHERLGSVASTTRPSVQRLPAGSMLSQYRALELPSIRSGADRLGLKASHSFENTFTASKEEEEFANMLLPFLKDTSLVEEHTAPPVSTRFADKGGLSLSKCFKNAKPITISPFSPFVGKDSTFASLSSNMGRVPSSHPSLNSTSPSYTLPRFKSSPQLNLLASPLEEDKGAEAAAQRAYSLQSLQALHRPYYAPSPPHLQNGPPAVTAASYWKEPPNNLHFSPRNERYSANTDTAPPLLGRAFSMDGAAALSDIYWTDSLAPAPLPTPPLVSYGVFPSSEGGETTSFSSASSLSLQQLPMNKPVSTQGFSNDGGYPHFPEAQGFSSSFLLDELLRSAPNTTCETRSLSLGTPPLTAQTPVDMDGTNNRPLLSHLLDDEDFLGPSFYNTQRYDAQESAYSELLHRLSHFAAASNAPERSYARSNSDGFPLQSAQIGNES